MTKQEFTTLLEESIPIPFLDPLAVLNKERSIKQYVSYMLDRTNQMFEYENLPETIPSYMLELYLQIFGSCAFTEVKSTKPLNSDNYKTPPGHYIFYGSLGGERDIYYRPTKFIIANPRIKNSLEATVVYDDFHTNQFSDPCVVIKNDTNYMGLLPLFSRYAAQLTENDISIRSAQINARAQVAIQVSTDREAETARKYLDNLEAGIIGVLGTDQFLEGVSVSNVGTQSSNHIIQLIELQQYLKASWYNELGLNVNFNMKREYMSEEEIAVNTDILLPLVDDMLRCREEAIDLINKTFNLNIKVMKSSAWANKEQEELSALMEGAQKGNTPIKNTIMERVNNESSIQTNVPGVQSPTEQEGPTGPETESQTSTNRDGTTPIGDNIGDSGEIQINVVVNSPNTAIDEDSQSESTPTQEESTDENKTPSESTESNDN